MWQLHDNWPPYRKSRIEKLDPAKKGNKRKKQLG
jgi:hypothetical protein